jgi:hypothetical protein
MYYALVVPRKRSLPRNIGLRLPMLVVNRFWADELCADADGQLYRVLLFRAHPNLWIR